LDAVGLSGLGLDQQALQMGGGKLKHPVILLGCIVAGLYALQKYIIATREPARAVSAETASGVGELLAAAEKVLQYRGVITDYPPLFLYERAECIPGFALDRLAEAVKKVKSMLSDSTEAGEK
jgi:hypothetical protein